MNTAGKILTLDEAIKLRSQWKQQGLKVAFTNGCFDIIHPGHVEYLENTRSLGDKLVLGLNTDASISNIKGPARPVVNEVARARVLAGLASVDAIVFFSDNTPLRLIEALQPDVLTKGSDYSIENIVGAEFVLNNGGSVETVDLVQGYSTSAIISKILKTG